MGPLPAKLDGLRVPARFVRSALIDHAGDGSLQVRAFRDAAEQDAPAARFTAFLGDGGAHHYFHFMEALIWLFTLHRVFLPGLVLERIVFAWPWDNPGQNHVQRDVLAALCPGVAIADSGGAWPATLDHALLFDRERRSTPLNKHLQAALGIAPPAVRAAGREARAWAGTSPSRHPGRLRLLAVTRPPPRCLTAAAEAELLALLARFGDVTVCDFGAVPWAQQVRLCAANDVMVGVHGNGLTNALWMHPGSLVLELFPDGVRHYDYQLFAELAGLAYYGFEGDRVFPAFSRTGESYGHHAPTQQPVTRVPAVALSRLLTDYAERRSAALNG